MPTQTKSLPYDADHYLDRDMQESVQRREVAEGELRQLDARMSDYEAYVFRTLGLRPGQRTN